MDLVYFQVVVDRDLYIVQHIHLHHTFQKLFLVVDTSLHLKQQFVGIEILSLLL
jgi:hypothetical protein